MSGPFLLQSVGLVHHRATLCTIKMSVNSGILILVFNVCLAGYMFRINVSADCSVSQWIYRFSGVSGTLFRGKHWINLENPCFSGKVSYTSNPTERALATATDRSTSKSDLESPVLTHWALAERSEQWDSTDDSKSLSLLERSLAERSLAAAECLMGLVVLGGLVYQWMICSDSGATGLKIWPPRNRLTDSVFRTFQSRQRTEKSRRRKWLHLLCW